MRTKEGNKDLDIINAAIAVFGDEGYNNAKMHHIAERAGIGIGTVYLYFRNKEKILLRILDKVWNELYEIVAAIKNSPDIDPVQKMGQLIDKVFDYFALNPKLSTILINQQQYIDKSDSGAAFQAAYAKTLEECECLISEGQGKGFFNPLISKRFFRNFFFGGIRNSLQMWANDTDAITLSQLRSNVKIVLLAGIAACKPDYQK